MTRLRVAARLLPFFAVGVAILGYALFVDGDAEPERSGADQVTAKIAPTSPSGPIVSLPDIGSFTWRCDDANRFSTTLQGFQATLAVSTLSDGKPLWTRKRVDPPRPPLRGRLSTPFEHVRRQTWRISYDRKPATIRAVVSVRFGVSRAGDCYTPQVNTRTSTDAHDAP